MRKLIIITAFIISTAGCTDRYNAFESLNVKPSIILKPAGKDQTKILIDSVKFYPGNYYNLSVEISDTNQNIQRLDFEAQPGQYNHVFVNGQEYPATLPVYNDKFTMNILCDRVGIYDYTFTLTDYFGKKDVATLSLNCFPNMPPMSTFNVKDLRQNDPLEYYLDGTASQDGDQRFGGRIKDYTWIINNTDSVSSNAAKIRYIFPQQGLFKIELRVTDNESAVGTSTQFVNIN